MRPAAAAAAAGAATAAAGARRGADASAVRFAVAAMALVSACAVFAGWMPLQFSIITVFLFAGPHNWFELRYFIARLPARLGRSRAFFTVAFVGVAALVASYVALPFVAERFAWGSDEWTLGVGLWNNLLVFWLAALILVRGLVRGRQRAGRRDPFWCVPVAFALVAANWLAPHVFSLALVYIHPLVALWFLERHLRRTRPASWQRAYRICLMTLPVFVGLLWWQLGGAPALAATDPLALRITRHAGSDVLQNTSSHLLVATHVFLETIHYAVWLVALPLVGGVRGGGGAFWRVGSLPLVRHPYGWPRLIRALLVVAAVSVVLLWLAFIADYATTRDLYFTLAMAHVLAEAPFLLRML